MDICADINRDNCLYLSGFGRTDFRGAVKNVRLDNFGDQYFIRRIRDG